MPFNKRLRSLILRGSNEYSKNKDACDSLGLMALGTQRACDSVISQGRLQERSND